MTALDARADVRAVVNQDGDGNPVRVELYFSRPADLSRTSSPEPAPTCWQVNFPSEADDTVGISVIVDSVTGATNLFADHMYGAPFVDLLHPRALDR